MITGPKSGSKAWWKTLPGQLSAAAVILAAGAGLVVALHQAGYFAPETQPPVPPAAQSKGAPQTAPDDPNASSMAGMTSRQLALPPTTEARFGDEAFKLLSAHVEPYSPDQVLLQLTISLTNDGRTPAHFWAASFRLEVGRTLQVPANDLDRLVEPGKSQQDEIDFVVPATASTAGLQMGNVGPGKPTIPVSLQPQLP
jgi:hypothetical protein